MSPSKTCLLDKHAAQREIMLFAIATNKTDPPSICPLYPRTAKECAQILKVDFGSHFQITLIDTPENRETREGQDWKDLYEKFNNGNEPETRSIKDIAHLPWRHETAPVELIRPGKDNQEQIEGLVKALIEDEVDSDRFDAYFQIVSNDDSDSGESGEDKGRKKKIEEKEKQKEQRKPSTRIFASVSSKMCEGPGRVYVLKDSQKVEGDAVAVRVEYGSIDNVMSLLNPREYLATQIDEEVIEQLWDCHNSWMAKWTKPKTYDKATQPC